MERQSIFEKVRAIIARVIEEDENEITIESSLIDDLGIESVDLVDISAKIEETFNIEIGEGELWNLTSLFTADGMVKNEKITARGAKELKKCFGENFGGIEPGTCLLDIFSLIKVGFIVDYLEKKLKTG